MSEAEVWFTLAQRTIVQFWLVALAGSWDREGAHAIWLSGQGFFVEPDTWTRLWMPDDEQPIRLTAAVAFDAHNDLQIVVQGSQVWHARRRNQAQWVGWNALGRPEAASSSIGGSTLARNLDQRLELVTKLGDGSLWHRWQTEPGGGAPWHPWRSLDKSGDHGSSTPEAPPVLASNVDGRLELFVTADDGALWHRWQTVPNGGWSAWSSLEAPDPGISGEPLVKRNADGCLELFTVASDGSVWHRWQTKPGGGPWAAWSPRGRVEITSPDRMAIGAHADGRLILFALSQTARGPEILRCHQERNNGWSGWRSLGRPAEVSPGPPELSESLTGIRFPALARDGSQRLQLWSLAQNPDRLNPLQTLFHRLDQLGVSDDDWTHSIHHIKYPPWEEGDSPFEPADEVFF
jgi:hypothetical protein